MTGTPVWNTVPAAAALRGLVIDPETARDQHGHQYERLEADRYGAARCGCCGELFSGKGYRASIPDGIGRRWLFVCPDHEGCLAPAE